MGSLYEHIVQLGKEKGFKTITALCREAGVPRATMTELKMGRSKDLSKPNAQKFADTLGVRLDVIYGEKEKPADQKVGELTKEELDYIEWFRQAPENMKEAVRLIIKGSRGNDG